MDLLEKRQLVTQQAIEKIKSLGFHVYGSIVTRSKPTWGYIRSKTGLRIGYFQANEFGEGIIFSTVRKPSYKHAKGSIVQTDDNYVTVEQITPEIILQSFNIRTPWEKPQLIRWLRRYQYRDFEEWLKEQNKYITEIQRY